MKRKPLSTGAGESTGEPSWEAVAGVLSRVMPFWYGLALLLMLTECFLQRQASGHWPGPVVAAALPWR